MTFLLLAAAALAAYYYLRCPRTPGGGAGASAAARGGRLFHGSHDVTDRLNGLRHEARTISRVLGVPVIPLIVMDGGAPIEGGELTYDGIRIVPAERAPAVLRSIGAARTRRDAQALAALATSHFPPYTRKHNR